MSAAVYHRDHLGLFQLLLPPHPWLRHHLNPPHSDLFRY